MQNFTSNLKMVNVEEVINILNCNQVRWNFVVRKKNNSCFVCESHGTNKERYITFKFMIDEVRIHTLHRLVFFIFNGYLPEVVMHKCDNMKCINPHHLIAGTFKQNSEDMVAKGHSCRGEKNGGGVKLNINTVKEIKKLITEGVSQRTLAKMYGVSRRTITFIQHRRLWKWVK